MKELPQELELPAGLLLAVLGAQQGVLRPRPWQKKHPARQHRESYSYGECGIGERRRYRGVAHEIEQQMYKRNRNRGKTRSPSTKPNGKGSITYETRDVIFKAGGR